MVEPLDTSTDLSGASSVALAGRANEFRSLPALIAEYAAKADAWRSAVLAGPQEDLTPEQSAELTHIVQLGMRLYHVLRAVDEAWAAEIRSGRLPHDWDDSKKICAVYKQWSQPSEWLMDIIDAPGAATEGDPQYAAFRDASIDAWFPATVDLERLRAADDRLNRRLRLQEGSGARSQSPDQVGR